ncbi:unnamed protein product [Anisakis simplex]|uniref:SH3 domain-containing protein n=1 Tax=Anisakis simplex TaxID=6269 RepID=A0A0M3K4C4_ANISI|nr:unnamed protein product [Anisakis simplex]
MTQVRAVYEFEAQPNSGELSISVDEILTVIREGIEGGWLEGRNAKGQHGLFPESYVIKVEPPLPPLPAIPAPPVEGLEQFLERFLGTDGNGECILRILLATLEELICSK